MTNSATISTALAKYRTFFPTSNMELVSTTRAGSSRVGWGWGTDDIDGR